MDGLDDLERYLRSARILSATTFGQHGAHKSFRLVLDGGVAVLAKPESTAPADGGAAMVSYEAAACVVARDLTWTDLVATTVVRRVDEVTGVEDSASVQVLWPEFEPNADLGNFRDDDIWRAAIFDVVVLHADRGQNWGGVPGEGALRLKLVDHGYAFRAWPNRPFASSFETLKRGQRIPDEYLSDLRAFAQGCRDSELPALLEEEVLDELVQRVERLIDEGTLGLA